MKRLTGNKLKFDFCLMLWYLKNESFSFQICKVFSLLIDINVLK